MNNAKEQIIQYLDSLKVTNPPENPDVWDADYSYKQYAINRIEKLLRVGKIILNSDVSDAFDQTLRQELESRGAFAHRIKKHSKYSDNKIADYYVITINKENSSMEKEQTLKVRAKVINEWENKKFSYVGLHESSVAEVSCNDAEKYRVVKIAYMNKSNEVEHKWVYVKSGEINKLSQQSFIHVIAYDNKYGNLMKQWMTIGDLKISYPTVQFFIPTQAVSILDVEESKV